MDFVDWSSQVLRKVAEASQSSSQYRHIGVRDDILAQFIFGELARQPGFFDSKQRQAMLDAAEELKDVRLLETPNSNYYKVTSQGQSLISDTTPLWEKICGVTLADDQTQLLQVVNRLSPQVGTNHVGLEWVQREQLFPELGWAGEDLLLSIAVAQELEKLHFVHQMPISDGLQLRATYRGLVWETRRGFTLESKFIDGLVREWETTSIDFKRELHTDTADQKAEFIKDVLGLINTQASGRRWMIIGFDDKTQSYHASPDPKLSQNHLEQLVAQYTTPIIELRYEVVDYRAGRVGKIEVLRDPKKLPYAVARGIDDKKSIEAGQIFVRHGSQTEAPTPAELQAIQDEGNRARA